MRIENLSKELDTETMSAVRGGDNGNSATNVIGQALNLSVPVAVQSYGPSNTNVMSLARRMPRSGTTRTPATSSAPVPLRSPLIGSTITF